MGDHSTIEWTDASWNPVTGCTRVSAGCDHCYAAREAATRLSRTRQYEGLAVITGSGRAAFNGTIRLLPERLEDPLRWRKPRMVFVNSMSDLFHEQIPDEFIDRVFAVMALAPEHTYQVLTKRPERMRAYFTEPHGGDYARQRISLAGLGLLLENQSMLAAARAHRGLLSNEDGIKDWPLPNVWLGVSCENQETFDARAPLLAQTPAAVRFLSCEPLLEEIDFGNAFDGPSSDRDPYGDIHWVIIGGESGPGARRFHLAWARAMVRVCQLAGVPVFVKQLGAQPVETVRSGNANAPVLRRLSLRDRKGGNPAEWPGDLRIREFPTVHLTSPGGR